MSKKLELNTAVRVTSKDGIVTDYPSLEEASRATGLSESAIKIRCNKSRQGSANKKDKIHCMWIDDHTFRSYQAKKSRRKGSNFELEVIKYLEEAGYRGLKTSRNESKLLDNNKIDITSTEDTLPCNIQCKNTLNTPNYYTISDSCSDKSKPFVIMWKKAGDSNRSLALIPAGFFYKLLKCYKKHEKDNE